MSFIGVSPSDFFQLAKLIRKVYTAYTTGPRQLQDLLEGLEDLESHAQSLGSILKVANLEESPNYPGFERLKGVLLNAQLLLAKHGGLSQAGNKLQKVVGAANFSVKQSDISDLKQRLIEHRHRMESYKTLLILRALYNNRRAGTETTFDLEAGTKKDDEVLREALSILEKRRQSFSMLNSSEMPSGRLSIVSTLAGSPSESALLYRDIVARAEASHLHYRDNNPSDNPEAWAEVIDRLAALLPGSTASTGFLLTPLSKSPETFRKGKEVEDTAGMGTWPLPQWTSPPNAAELEALLPPPESLDRCWSIVDTNEKYVVHQPSILEDRALFAPLIVDETHSIPTGRQSINLANRVQVYCEVTARTWGIEWIDVRLEISQNENELYLWATSERALPRLSMTNPPLRRLAPQDILHTPMNVAREAQAYPVFILKHTIFSSSNSYPVVHHPAVEKGKFDIEFYTEQIVKDESSPNGPEHVSKLTYRLESKQDRDELRSKIFGKRLLASAGYQDIEPAGACNFQTLTVWEDHHVIANGEASVVITVPCNSVGGQSWPTQVMMFRVTGCSKLDLAKKDRARLILNVEPNSSGGSDLLESSRRSSVFSNSTTSSGRSDQRKNSAAGSSRIDKKGVCKILLSDHNDACKADKKALIRILRAKFNSG